jgi:hypothetical protein
MPLNHEWPFGPAVGPLNAYAPALGLPPRRKTAPPQVSEWECSRLFNCARNSGDFFRDVLR